MQRSPRPQGATPLTNAWRGLWLVGAAALWSGRNAIGADGGSLDRYEQSQVHMATIVKVVVYAPTPGAATAGCDAAFARCKELNEILSDYLDESELNRFCADGFGR